jgi:hypothetical protein
MTEYPFELVFVVWRLDGESSGGDSLGTSFAELLEQFSLDCND